MLTLILLLVICISLAFINPSFGPIGYMIFLLSTMGMRLRTENFVESDYKHLKKENNPLLTLLNNCNTFLNKHFEKNKEVRSMPIKDLSDIDFADNIIRQYLDDGYLSDNIDSKIKEIVVKLLQDELKSEENDIKVLLNIAKENLEIEKDKNKDNKMKKLS